MFVIRDFYFKRHRIVELDGSSRNQMKTVSYLLQLWNENPS